MMNGVRVALVLLLVTTSAAGVAFAQDRDAALAGQVLGIAGVRTGLCVQLGAGREASPGLTAELAAQSRLLVHAIALDDASLSRARKAIDVKGLSGRAMAEKVAAPPLPYLNDLADLVVVEDMPALEKRGITMDEVLRVASPGGVVCTLQNGRWTKAVKPRPKEMDEWTHPLHGADGNLVSTDMIVKLPLSYRWIDGFPYNITGFAATRAWVIAGGRLFALGINEVENLGTTRAGQYEQYLSARDAFNGLPLWKINCGIRDDGTGIMWENAGPLAADDQRVYTVQKDRPIIVDAASGNILAACETKYPAAKLLVVENILVVACWDAKARVKGEWLWLPKSSAGTVQAFDAATGKPMWSADAVAFRMIASDGVVYLFTRTVDAPDARQVVALDLKTGKERWRVPQANPGVESDVVLEVAGPGYVVVARPGENVISVLSAQDGRVLWEIKPAKATWTPIIDGLLCYGGKKYDPKTGEVKGTYPGYFGGHGCSFRAVAGSYLVSGYGFAELSPAAGAKRQTALFTGGRGACIEDWVPANGMFYTAQNNCKCMPGAIYGFLAIGPNGDWPITADFERPRPAEKGPAFGTADAAASGDDDWPTYRRDAERSASTKAVLPEKLKQAWRAAVAKPAEGPLAMARESRLGPCLSAPVSAGPLVFAAACDAGQVVALDAVTGNKVWSVTLGSRLDTPPTVYRGLCLIGCHDGWVYALRAKDGELAWRTCAAPWERRLVAWGEVESVWPVIGTVLVHEGVAYVTAGRSTESDGGIAVVALDPVTGSFVWGKEIAPGALRMNDILSVRDGSIAWRYIRLDAKTGVVTAPAAMPTPKDYGGGKGLLEGAMIDGTWSVTTNRRAGNAFTLGKQTANLLAWNEKTVLTAAAAVSRETEANLWPTGFSRREPPVAMALAGNVAVFARLRSGADGKPAGTLTVFSIADGRKLAEFPLDSPPAYDGLAVANGRVFLSLQDGSMMCFAQGE